MSRAAIVLMVLAGAAVIAVPAPVQAQNYPWCSNFHDGAGVNCGFVSEQQCQATAGGTGGFCTPNNTYRPAAAAASVHAPRRSAHAKR